MRFRKLRIAWSVMWSLLAVLLVVLWVRSYWQAGCFGCQSRPSFFIHSQRGQLTYMSGLPERVRLGFLRDSTFFDATRVSPPPVWGFGAATSGGIISLLFLPYWPVVLLASTLAVLGVLPWLRWRFSLRTVLIAMTLVALVLGAIVWLR
jgi:hypothetical protein